MRRPLLLLLLPKNSIKEHVHFMRGIPDDIVVVVVVFVFVIPMCIFLFSFLLFIWESRLGVPTCMAG